MHQSSYAFLFGVAASHAFVLPRPPLSARRVSVSLAPKRGTTAVRASQGASLGAVSDEDLGDLDVLFNGDKQGKIAIEIPRPPKSSTEAAPSMRLGAPLPLAPV